MSNKIDLTVQHVVLVTGGTRGMVGAYTHGAALAPEQLRQLLLDNPMECAGATLGSA